MEQLNNYDDLLVIANPVDAFSGNDIARIRRRLRTVRLTCRRVD
jgi:hypothetical protein